MKILHVDPETGFGGGERQVAGLVRHLARRGHDNVLVAAPAGALAARVPAADARLRPLVIRNDVDVLAALRLRRQIRIEHPDIVHFHTSRAHAMSPWIGRTRAIVTRRMDYRLRPGRRVDLLYNRSVAAVVAISNDVRQKLLAAGVRPERVRVIRSAVEPPARLPGAAERAAARARHGIASDETAIGVVAALERRKAHDVLLHALAATLSKLPPLRVLFCGDGSERAALGRLTRELGLESRVRFLGELAQVADVLAAIDLFVLPSRHEGLGVAVLEAMAVGLPVVASAVGGLPEVVDDGKTGLLVPPDDPRALGAAIAVLAGDVERARRMGAAGRARVLAEFSMERMADAYEALYTELAPHAAQPRAQPRLR